MLEASYASVEDVESGFRELTESERATCQTLLTEAAAIIDAYNSLATEDIKQVVSCRMVRRAMGEADGSQSFPLGTTQGSISAGGYSQSWTIGSGGTTGELYLGRLEKRLLGVGNKIGSYSPIEEKVVRYD